MHIKSQLGVCLYIGCSVHFHPSPFTRPPLWLTTPPPSVYLDSHWHSRDKMNKAFPLCFAHCKWSKPRPWEGLGTSLEFVGRWTICSCAMRDKVISFTAFHMEQHDLHTSYSLLAPMQWYYSRSCASSALKLGSQLGTCVVVFNSGIGTVALMRMVGGGWRNF